MEEFEVAVVGGGPAGCRTAAEAARKKSTVVFESGVSREEREDKGADSTDAAGLLDYWLELMDVGPDEFDDLPVLQEIESAEFVSPAASVEIDDTGIDSWYDGFAVTFDRVAMDDLLRRRAEDAGAEYRISSVRGTREERGSHVVETSDGEVKADYLVLADGPQRRVTLPTLERYVDGDDLRRHLGPADANHIAYQEHRRFPEELFDDDILRFWWGYIPGDTAYPWTFPNDDRVVRFGLTMPSDLDLSLYDHGEYPLLDADDDTVPAGRVYLERLLEHLYPEYSVEDFPLVEDRGKRGGVESYPISSTRPVESPVEADVAVVGGAMGATSAFHEGGYHLGYATGEIAGRCIAEDRIEDYNDEWRSRLGSEMNRNVGLARLVEGYRPSDYDRLFRVADDSLHGGILTKLKALPSVLRLRWRYGGLTDDYVAFTESDYDY